MIVSINQTKNQNLRCRHKADKYTRFVIGGRSCSQLFSKIILFICKATDDPELNELQQHAVNATKKAVNAFELLMAGGRSFPDKKRSNSGVKGGLSRKDELYNNLIETFFKQHKLDLPKPVLQTEGSYIVQI
uniref:Uncharacterized protein n=1 Tax=Magallana gigas TaxID=29159 RepID=A0A8W8HRH3_MAGGI